MAKQHLIDNKHSCLMTWNESRRGWFGECWVDTSQPHVPSQWDLLLSQNPCWNGDPQLFKVTSQILLEGKRNCGMKLLSQEERTWTQKALPPLVLQAQSLRLWQACAGEEREEGGREGRKGVFY